jgi:arabinogalactan oligomer/maltooligosaccharide transport system permease protein
MAEVKINEAPKATPVASRKTSSMSGARRLNIILKLVIAIVAAFIALYPIAYVIAASVNPTNSLTDLVPANPNLNNYNRLLSDEQYPVLLWLFNSIKVAVLSTIITVTLTTMAAYAFSRFRFKGRRQGLLVILLIQLFPNTLAIVSLYLLLTEIGHLIPWLGINSHGGLILIYSGGALGFNTWLMKGFFDTIPKELDESGVIDGASPTQIFIFILLPLIRPILAVVSILAFIGTYADFLIASIMLQDKENYTLAVGLNLLLGSSGGQRSSNWGLFAAAAIIGAFPIVIVFLILQKQLIGGLTTGAVKG